ncbi:hypothetical protein MRX96_050728 [Rhipicephalus microplus]
MFAKTTYLSNMVSRNVLGPCVEVLRVSLLYEHYSINVDEGRLERLYRGAVAPDEDFNVEACPDLADLDDPMNVATALTLDQHTLVYDENAVLTMAPGEGKRTVSILYDTHAEELSFPQIYLGQAHCITPEAKPTLFFIASSEIRRKDRRGALPMHVLYMAMKVWRHRVSSPMTVMYRSSAITRGLTRQDIEDLDKVKQFIEQDLVFMEGVPDTVQYWHKRKSELFAMIRQPGKATVFLTLSASEMHWPKLLELLAKLQVRPQELGFDEDEINQRYAAMLVNNDPAACAIYFEHMVRVIMKVLRNSRTRPFKPYHVVKSFKRTEFQHRGSPHAHLLLWLNLAPNDEVQNNFIPKTMRMAEHLLSVDHDALERPRCQEHQHTHTCYKGGRKKCRFHAPFWPIPSTEVLTPLQAPCRPRRSRFETILLPEEHS